MAQNFEMNLLATLAAPKTGHSKSDSRSTLDATKGAISNKHLMGGSRGVHVELYKLKPLMGDTGSKTYKEPGLGKGKSNDSSVIYTPNTGNNAFHLQVGGDATTFLQGNDMGAGRLNTMELSNNLSQIPFAQDNWNSFARDFPELK